MAENSVILSVEEEAKLLKPIDEYVEKIQKKIDALRVDGSDKVNDLKNQIAIAKENKNLSKEQRDKIIENSKKELENAKKVEADNKEEIKKLIAEAEDYLAKHYKKDYYDVVNNSCKAAKAEENSRYEKVKADLKSEHQKKIASLKDAEEIKAEKYVLKNKLFDAQMTHESRMQEIKDRRHEAFMHKYHDRSAENLQVHIPSAEGTETGKLQILLQFIPVFVQKRSVHRNHPDFYCIVYHHTDC